ncbi:hypothetical protein EIP86_000619 [Pleurotus ostreatoroseus]|nr:hypothetical protein EIP86_000619 [Pleurotus ostreatoroseus]
MSSSQCINLWLRNVPRRTNPLTRHGRFASRALSTTNRVCSAAGPAYVQKPDKTHPTRVESVQPAIANQVSIDRHSKLAEKLKTSKNAEARRAEEAKQELSSKSQLEQLDELEKVQHVRGIDIWAQPLDLLDVSIPTWKSEKKDASLLDHIGVALARPLQWWRNVQSMWLLASENSFPGINVKYRISLQIFKLQSSHWLAPFRNIALQTYKDVNTALAAGDLKTIRKLTGSEYETHLTKLIRGRDSSRTYVWNFVKEEKPCKVVSLRAIPGYLASQPPKIGNRLLIQALVKFDTLQTLQVYNKKGDLIHDEKPRRVVQYLVLQKRMWYNSPWIIRNELFENMDE